MNDAAYEDKAEVLNPEPEEAGTKNPPETIAPEGEQNEVALPEEETTDDTAGSI